MSSNLTDLNAAKFFENLRGFKPETLPADARELLIEMARRARRSILKMTTLAASGHPGGSMSSLEFYLLVYNFANLRPGDPRWADRDRVLISHGHTSPGIYSALGHSGFLDVEQAILGFRLAGSPFEGHVERSAPGVEWDSGNLGQGLSAACGKAVAARALEKDFHVYTLMGDGEQQKGQISEARRFAVKYGFTNITGVIDLNRLQISGDTKTIMPQRIADNWRSDGWNVVEGDGHDLDEMYSLLRTARNDTEKPTVILAHTIMGKGYPPIENDHNYHGAALSEERCIEALAILGNDNGAEELESLKAKRAQGVKSSLSHPPRLYPSVATGSPRTYEVDKKIDNRSAWGNALVDLALENSPEKSNGAPMVVFDCDLAVSVKTNGFADKFPEMFFQAGISEHSTATTAGACSAEGVLTFWADFGVFGIAETYNQNRLNDINEANLKVVCTHCGLDVGEDGKTHQSIDYFALSRSVFGWKLLTPADPNQTDRITRYIASLPGNFLMVMGRSKINPVSNNQGNPFFGADYEFRPDRTDKIRDGEGATIVCAGAVLGMGLEAWEKLSESGKNVRLISAAHWADFHADDLREICEFGKIVTVEDHNINTGFGMSLSSELFSAGLAAQIVKIGVTRYGSSGKAADLYKLMGIDGESIASQTLALLENTTPVENKINSSVIA